MRDRLTESLKTATDVEYADIRLEDKTNTWVNFRGPDLDTIGSARTVGGIVRALHQGGWEDERDLFDQPGGYQRLMSNQTAGQPCPTCGTLIQKIAYLGGACYLCPHCQV